MSPAAFARVRWGRRLVVAVLTGIATLMVTVGIAVTAHAHAELLETDPPDGTALDEAPAEVTLTFNEPVQLREDFIRVFDAAGIPIDIAASASGPEVTIELPAGLEDGSYVVSWRVISADTHPVAGGFTFAIGEPDPAVASDVVGPPTDAVVDVSSAVVRAISYPGLLAAAGLVVFQIAAIPYGERSARWVTRLRRPAVVAGAVAAVALLLNLPLTATRQSGQGLEGVAELRNWTGPLLGDPGLVLAVAVFGLVVAFAATAGGRQGPLASALALGGAALAVCSQAFVGHTRTFGPEWLVVGSHLVHVATAAVWFGGLIALTLMLRPSHRPAAPAAGAVVSRFSSLAAAVVAVLATAGVLLGWRIVGSWSALFGTPYGLILLAKVGAAVAVVAVAAYNRYRLVPQLRESPRWPVLRRTVSAEAGILVAVLALTGVLVGSDPRQAPERGGGAADTSGVMVEHELPDGVAILQVTPGTLGTNAIEIELVHGDGRPLEPLEDPRVRLSLPETGFGPIERSVTATGPGAFQASGEFPLEGDWVIELSIRISRFEEQVARFEVEVR